MAAVAAGKMGLTLVSWSSGGVSWAGSWGESLPIFKKSNLVPTSFISFMNFEPCTDVMRRDGSMVVLRRAGSIAIMVFFSLLGSMGPICVETRFTQ